MFESIVEAIASHAQAAPDRLFAADAAQSFTYGEAWQAILGFALRLREAGVRRGDFVLVECTQDVRYCIAGHAVQLSGAVFVPFDRKAGAERLEEMAAETGARYLVSLTPRLPELGLITMESIAPQGEPLENPFPFPRAGERAEILYSTGTTGKSKGIELTHGNNVALAENISFGVEMCPGDVELVPVSLSHSHGLRTTYANFLYGNAVVITDGVTFLNPLFALMRAYHVTGIDLVPSALRMILKLAPKELAAFQDTLHYIELGSAPLTDEDKRTLSALLPHTRLYNFYGSTESGRSCVFEFSRYPELSHCIGRPARNAEILVVDGDRRPIESSPERTGRLAFRGGMNMTGYWGNPELTASILEDGVVYTNDVGYIDQDGLTYMLGREDDVINYCGIKISPDEVEAAALRCEGVADCGCVGVEDPLCGQSPVLFVRRAEGAALEKAELLRFLGENMDKDKLPRRVVFIDSIPRASNGKLQRRALKDFL